MNFRTLFISTAISLLFCSFFLSAFCAALKLHRDHDQHHQHHHTHQQQQNDNKKNNISISVPAGDPRFGYDGRWLAYSSLPEQMKSDWTCSTIRFRIQNTAVNTTTTPNSPTIGTIKIVFKLQGRVNCSVSRPAGKSFGARNVISSFVFEGKFFEWNADEMRVGEIIFGNQVGVFDVRCVKLTTARPFGTGIGGVFLPPSTFTFFGLTELPAGTELINNSIVRRRIQTIGASDSAGYCVDGSHNISGVKLALTGWSYVNCDFSYSGFLSRYFDATLSVQASSGIGIYQNAFSNEKWKLGALTMPDYFNRTMQSNPKVFWDFNSSVMPDLTIVSLGGNDYNNQPNGSLPSNATFTETYKRFLLFLFNHAFVKNKEMKLLVVCGMGEKHVAKLHPNNNRCHPCPHVQDAVNAFRSSFPVFDDRIHYQFIPCDGSVVRREAEIGCDGHKNRAGQEAVARFLRPKIAEMMNWKD